MERTLRVKRIFTMGQFQNLEIGDEITNIPENIAKNEEALSLISYLQLLLTERKYNRYLQLRERTREMSPEDAINYIEDQVASTKSILTDILTKE